MKTKMLTRCLTLTLATIVFGSWTPAAAMELTPVCDNMIYAFYEDAAGELCEDVTWLDITAGPMSYEAAVAWADSCSACGYTDWRLPTQRELQILTQKHGITTDNQGPFENLQAEWYWSSTEGTDGHRMVHLHGTGSSTGSDSYLGGYVMVVRDGMSICNEPVKQALENLIDMVMDLNTVEGICNSLDAKLNAAFWALEDLNNNNDVAAVNTLWAFIECVESQAGKHITQEDAETLVAAAMDIINAIEAS